MLKSVSNKPMGALLMVGAMVIIALLPWVCYIGSGKYCDFFIQDTYFKNFHLLFFVLFIMNNVLLGWLGSLPVTETNQNFMQLFSCIYMFYFLVLTPLSLYRESALILKIAKNIAF